MPVDQTGENIISGAIDQIVFEGPTVRLTVDVNGTPIKVNAGGPERGLFEEIAKRFYQRSDFLYLGRGVHYAVAREGALKMKESSYVQAEGYPTGELKHGPNALVGEHVPLMVLATVDRTLEDSILRYEKTLQLLEDMKRQGARVIALANCADREVAGLVTDCIFVEPVSEHLLPIPEVIPLQLFSYAMALEHGVDVDRPRNLSKAVIEA